MRGHMGNSRVLRACMGALVVTCGALPSAEAAEISREDAMKESHKLNCYQNYMPMSIIQKLGENTFFGYTRFSVGTPEPMILVYAIGRRPISSGMTMLSPRDGLVFSGEREIQMESGFQKKVSVLKIGDKKCAGLWAIIEKALLAK